MSFKFNSDFEKKAKKHIIKELGLKKVSEDEDAMTGHLSFHNWEELDTFLKKLENVNIDSIKESAIKEFGNPPE